MPEDVQSSEQGEPQMDREALEALLTSLSPETDEGDIRKAFETLGTEIADLRAAAKTLDDAAKLRELRASQQQLHTELQRRVDEATAVAEALSETEGELAAPEVKPAAEAGGPGDPEDPEDPPAEEGGEDDEQEPAGDKVPVSAAARAKGREVQTTGEKEPVTAGAGPLPFVWRASAGQGRVVASAEIDKSTLYELFEDARAKAGNSPGQYVVATVPSYQELGQPVVSSRDGVAACDHYVAAVQSRWAEEHNLPHQPVTAAICEPYEVVRELAPFNGVTDTPFADAFPQTAMTRLGLRLTARNWTLADMNDAFAMPWTGQDAVDEGDPDTWKPCITIPCPTTFDITAEELTACFRVRDDTLMSSPETVDDFQELLFIQRARRREQYLLEKFDAHASTHNLRVSTGVFNSGVDALPALAEAVATTLAHARYPNRIDLDTYTLVLPPNLDLVLRIGRTKRAFGDSAMSVADVEAFLRDVTGVGNIVWLRDNRRGGIGAKPQPTLQASSVDGNPEAVLGVDDEVIDALNAAFRVRLVTPGDAIYSVTGELQTGLETDPQLLRQNMRQWFLKEWVGFGKNGPNPWVTLDFSCLIPSGASVGFMTPISCAAAS